MTNALDQPRVVVVGSFDTKGEEYAFLCDAIKTLGREVLTVNTGVLGSTRLFPVDIEAGEVASAAGADLATLRTERDRGKAMAAIAAGAASVVQTLHAEGRVAGIIGMGGSGGTSVITSAMRALPIGVPKVCVSTVAGGNTAPYVGLKDITLIPSIADVAGLNRISRMILTRAAGAIVGMTGVTLSDSADDRPIVAASMFGNTTECVDRCRSQLNEAGYEVLVFHATGTGGRTMEALIDEGFVDACLDITTTEWADTVCGGVFDAGEDRLSAAGRRGIPHLIVPGCIDMANFGPLDTVPQAYRDAGRQLYSWNPSVTLMRTNVDENRRMGRVFAEKANAATGPVAFLIPLRGVSILDGDGQQFCDREADQAMFATLREHLRPSIAVVELDANINDPAFADKAVEMMLGLIEQQRIRRDDALGRP
jgi:uncharacterized protein (UPF0261 family)